MIEVEQDLWTVEADIRCITTNGTVIRDTLGGYKNVMGAGCAKEAALKFPELPWHYATFIRNFGNHVYLMRVVNRDNLGFVMPLVMFPTKEDVRGPSTIERVTASAKELLVLTDLYGWNSVALPRPGCGLGGLNYETQVLPILEAYLWDDRFIIVDYPKGNK